MSFSLLIDSSVDFPVLIDDWWSTEPTYQLLAWPVLFATMGIMVAPMKGLREKGLVRGRGTFYLLLVVGVVVWVISMLMVKWTLHGLFHFNYQFHMIIITISYPVTFFIFFATLLLKNPPRVGDGRKHLKWEVYLLVFSLLPIVLVNIIQGVFVVPGSSGMFALDILWWWPASQIFNIIFVVSLSLAIVTGSRAILVAMNKKSLGRVAKKFFESLSVTRGKKSAFIMVAVTCAFLIAPAAGIMSVDDDPPMILVNQVGYLNDSPKRILFQAPSGQVVPGVATYSLINSSSGEVVYNGTFRRNGSYYQHWYMDGDFSNFTSNGTYFARATVNGRSVSSPEFRISPRVYDILLDRAVDFYYYQRCGFEVEPIVDGYNGHHACHLDDAMVFNGTSLVYKNLSGGWHDAGDYNKYNGWFSTQWHSLQSIADAWLYMNETYIGLEDQYDSDAPDIIDELLWGATYLAKCVDEMGIRNDTFGLIINDVVDWNWDENKSAHMSYWGPPDHNTDNIVGTGDERVVFQAQANPPYPLGWKSAEGGYGFAGAMLKVARVIDGLNFTAPSWAINRSRLLEVAGIINASYQPLADGLSSSTIDGTPAPPSWGPHLWSISSRLLYESEMALITGNWTLADNCSDILVQWMPADFSSGSAANFMGFLLRYFLEYGRPLPAAVITRIQEWQGTVYKDHYLGPFNVFHVFDGGGSPILFGRASTTAGGIINADHCNYMWCQVLMNELDPGSGRIDLVQSTLDYLLGVNPLGLCQVDGVGGQFVSQIHHRYSNSRYPSGRVPGGIINGIRRYQPSPFWASMHHVDRDDAWTLLPEEAWVDNWPGSPMIRDGVDAHSNEIWLPHNAGFLEMLSSYLHYH
ncbi:MAG: glycoside hydrolase family 9 protein [Promethearchaeota archaeon]